MANETILVIDDDTAFVDLLNNHILRQAGYKTICAYNGSDGLNKILSCQPDLVMLDNNMPRMKGLDVLEALQHLDAIPPIIFMTSDSSEETAVQAFRLGARNYINKRFSVKGVQIVIEQALRENRLIQEKIDLQNNLVMAKTVRQTVITLSHHINNHLMSTSGNLELLQEAILAQPTLENEEGITNILQNSFQGLEKIKEILKTLEKLNVLEPIAYTENDSMLDTRNLE
jgi:two-component system NtrC family sensor kinase